MNTYKSIALGVVALVAFISFGWIVQTYIFPSGAATSKVSIDIIATHGESAQGESTPPSSSPEPDDVINTIAPIRLPHATFLVASDDPNDRISGVDLLVEVRNGELTGWDGCRKLDDTVPLPNDTSGDQGLRAQDPTFTELISRTGKNARYSCVAIKDAAQLPSVVSLGGDIRCTSSSNKATVTVSRSSQVSGPVEGSLYEIDRAGTVEVRCDGDGQGGDDGSARYDYAATFLPKACTDAESCRYGLTIWPQRDRNTRISGMYVKLSYDEDIVELQDIILRKGDADVQGTTTLLAQNGTNVTPTPSSAPNAPTTAPVVTTAPGTTVPTTAPGTNVPTTVPSGAPTTFPSPTIIVSPSPTGGPIVSVSPTPDPIGGDGALCRIADKRISNGTAEFIYTCDSSAADLPGGQSFDLDFDVVGQGRGELKIDAIQVVGPQRLLYTVHKGKAEYRIGDQAGDGNIQLDMKLRMQCVQKKPKGAQEMQVRVGLGDGTLRKPIFDTATFKVDERGFWNGTVSFNAPAGSGYKVLVKGDKHMQKKICESNPREGFPGAYGCDKGTISLRDGKNTLDLSNIVLLTGDLPPGEQDGISNAKDQSLVRNLVGKRDKESAALADINYDGVVNAVDHSCMIAALSVRWDEE